MELAPLPTHDDNANIKEAQVVKRMCEVVDKKVVHSQDYQGAGPQWAKTLA